MKSNRLAAVIGTVAITAAGLAALAGCGTTTKALRPPPRSLDLPPWGGGPVTEPFRTLGRFGQVSGALTGSAHDLTCARIWGIISELAAARLIALADKGFTGVGEPVRTPYRGRNKPASQKTANRAHAQLRTPGEGANAQLKAWHILRRPRCCPWCAGQLAKAIHVPQTRETAGCRVGDWRGGGSWC